MTEMRGTHERAGQRERIAGELHDGAMQELTLARLQIDLLCASLRGDPGLAGQLVELAEMIDDASWRLQDLLRSLVPGPRLVQPSTPSPA